jgi:hypothetical protein
LVGHAEGLCVAADSLRQAALSSVHHTAGRAWAELADEVQREVVALRTGVAHATRHLGQSQPA